MSFGGHFPKPGRHAPEGKPEPKATPDSDSGGSTPKTEGGNPRVSLADYERLKEVVKRLSGEKSAAFVEIDALVNDNKDLRKREEELLEHQADLSILDMEGNKSTKVPPFTGTDKDEYSADIWLTNVTRLGELNNWKDEQILKGCLLALKDVASCLLYTSPSPRD